MGDAGFRIECTEDVRKFKVFCPEKRGGGHFEVVVSEGRIGTRVEIEGRQISSG